MVERTLSLSGFHPLRFFSKLGNNEKNAAFFTSGKWQIITWNPSRTVRGTDSTVFAELKTLPKQHRHSSLPFTGGALGYCNYDFGFTLHGLQSKHHSALPLALFHVYDHAVLWDGKQVIVLGDDRFSEDVQDIFTRPFHDVLLPSMSWKSSMTKTEYRKKFASAMRGIRDGDFYQLNLSYPFSAHVSIDHRKLFAALADVHPASSAAYFEHDETAILSLSPERFVTISKGVITTSPIKGTCPRGKTPAQDTRLAEGLLRNSKEAAELNMITDLLRNDVGKVSEAGSVKVLEHRSLQKNPSVWHTYSVIQGTLEKNLHPVDAFASMLPGGSVTGCPKVAAMQKIDNIENQPRGAYCGSMLLLSSSGFLDSTILIRTIEARKKTLQLGMGGGIVADSDCMQEYDETLKKAQPFLDFSLSQSPRYYRGQRQILADKVSSLFDPAHKKIVGVFETMRAENGKIHDLSAHLRRLKHSADLVGLHIPSLSVLAKNLKNSVAAVPSFVPKTSAGRRKPMLYRSRSFAHVLRIKIICTQKDVIIETRILRTDPARRYGISVLVLPLDRALPEAKSLPYHREYRAHQQAVDSGFGEAVLRRSDGSVLEGAYSNVFFINNKTLWTANTDILFGITRKNVLRLARRLKIPVRFVSLQEQDIVKAEEIFLTSSLTGITPVIKVGDIVVGNGRPGRITQRLQKAFDTDRV